MTTAQADPMIGRLVDGRYQVRSRIARGGMATVYLATDLRLERRVAIKIMHGHLADDNTFKTRFVQEARSAARLAHPNVVNVFDQGQDEDMAYLVMEYLPGITLRDLLKDYKRLTAEQTVDILDAVLAGLAAAHRAGIIHRDVKPENVLLADDGRIKLSDFGLARAASQNTATGQALLGTIAYLSPELVTRGVADARSDVYALGIMLYEMLTGEQPFVGEAPMQIAYQHANDEVPAPSSKVPSVPAELDELVAWATRRNPDERPADAGALLDRLRRVESGLRGGFAGTTGTRGGTGAQPTLVIGDLAPGVSATAETTVLGARAAAPSKTSALDVLGDDDESSTPAPVAALHDAARRRKRRGWWIFGIVVLLAALGGGLGWWFGAGPAAFTTVEDVRTLSPEEATAVLEKQGFVVDDTGHQNDPEVPAGQVAATDPEAGRSVRNGSTIKLMVSDGPRIIAVPGVVGGSVADAKTALVDFKLGADDERYTDEAPKDTVLALLDGSDNPIEEGTELAEGTAMTLVVSHGPIPEVRGMTVEAATKALNDAGFVDVQVNEERKFDDSGEVADGLVLRAGSDDDPIRPSTTMWITVSKGQDLVDLPDVTGQKVDAAVETLEAAGFKVDTAFPGILWGAATVTSQTPEGGQAVRGSTVKLTAQLTL